MCALYLLCTFGRFVTRERFGRAHAPLLVIKTYEHLCVCLVPSLYIRFSCDDGVFRACPCTSPHLKDVQAFVIVFLSPSLYVRSSCDKGAFGHAHALLLLIKAHEHS